MTGINATDGTSFQRDITPVPEWHRHASTGGRHASSRSPCPCRSPLPRGERVESVLITSSILGARGSHARRLPRRLASRDTLRRDRAAPRSRRTDGISVRALSGGGSDRRDRAPVRDRRRARARRRVHAGRFRQPVRRARYGARRRASRSVFGDGVAPRPAARTARHRLRTPRVQRRLVLARLATRVHRARERRVHPRIDSLPRYGVRRIGFRLRQLPAERDRAPGTDSLDRRSPRRRARGRRCAATLRPEPR